MPNNNDNNGGDLKGLNINFSILEQEKIEKKEREREGYRCLILYSFRKPPKIHGRIFLCICVLVEDDNYIIMDNIDFAVITIIIINHYIHLLLAIDTFQLESFTSGESITWSKMYQYNNGKYSI